MITFRSPDLEARLSHLANVTGRNKTFYLKEALQRFLDDYEDLYIAEQRIVENSNPDGTRKKENYLPKNGRSLKDILNDMDD